MLRRSPDTISVVQTIIVRLADVDASELINVEEGGLSEYFDAAKLCASLREHGVNATALDGGAAIEVRCPIGLDRDALNFVCACLKAAEAYRSVAGCRVASARR